MMSPLVSKSAKKKPAPAAAPAPSRGVVVEKPKADIYTAMLIVSLVAIVIACLCLYLEMRTYDFNLKGR
jgi:hypothetical protein